MNTEKGIAYPFGEEKLKDILDYNRELLKHCPNAAVLNPDCLEESKEIKDSD